MTPLMKRRLDVSESAMDDHLSFGRTSQGSWKGICANREGRGRGRRRPGCVIEYQVE
jgi:hypothetical protein